MDKKVALVTGSSKGIGRAIAALLVEQGMNVVITSRDSNRAQNVARELSNSSGGDALGLACDLDNLGSLYNVLDKTIDTWGRLDVLVNNALTQSCAMPLDDMDDDALVVAIQANLAHVILLSRKAMPYLEQSNGCVVNIGSVIVNRYVMGLPVYATVKAALNQLTRSLAVEWAPRRIRVNAVNPGFIKSSSLKDLGLPPEIIEGVQQHCAALQPIGRIGEPEDVAGLVSYLVSAQSSLITGSVFDIDGGYSVGDTTLFPPS